MQDDIREQLIKQFPSDVVEILDQSGKPYYGCPTWKRAGACLGSYPQGKPKKGDDDSSVEI